MYPTEIFRDTLSRLLPILINHGVRFQLTGGITTVAYGEPRMTQGIDTVVDNPARPPADRPEPDRLVGVLGLEALLVEILSELDEIGGEGQPGQWHVGNGRPAGECLGTLGGNCL